MTLIKEGKIEIFADNPKIVSKKMGVFYNPIMQVNRDLTLALLNTMPNKNMNIADPLAGTGVRAIRIIKELNIGKIKAVYINDQSKDACLLIQQNLKNNNLKKFEIDQETAKHHIHIFQKDANLFLLESKGFDYIDIDPFGTPNPFLDSAIQRMSRNGILGVTATDTSALAGTYPKACQRKYWALPKRNALKHEIGLRILIRKVQLIGTQYEKALIPIYSYTHDHYMRVFFKVEKAKTACDNVIKQHDAYEKVGPLWTGQLWDKTLAKRISMITQEEKHFHYDTKKLAKTIAQEAQVNSTFFFDVHNLAKKEKLKDIPSFEKIIGEVKKKKQKISRTHFSKTGLKTTMKRGEFVKLLKKLVKEEKTS